MRKIRENGKVFWWAIKLAYRLSPNRFLFWLLFSVSLALLPSLALFCNRNVVAILTDFLITGEGTFRDILCPLSILGAVLILIGFSQRINSGFLYVVMYDDFCLGIQEYFMDCIQKIDIKTLMDKKFYEEYQYCFDRAGALNDFLSNGCVCIMKGVSAISLIMVAFSVSIPIGFVSMACLVSSVFLNLQFSNCLVRDNFKYQELHAEATHYMEEVKKPGVAKEMRIYQNQERFLKRWKNAYQKEVDYDKARDYMQIKLSSGISACLYAAVFFMLLFSCYQVMHGRLSVDVFLMLYLMGENLSEINNKFSKSLFEMIRGFQALQMQYRFLHRVSMHTERLLNQEEIEHEILEQQAKSEIVFEGRNLSFSYDGKAEVLHGLDFQIKKGETIALVGRNGSGKSTLVKLLVDLYQPDKGELYYFGKNYKDYPMGSINRGIGMFFQNFYLYHLSIRENVGFGNLKFIKDDVAILSAMEKGGATSIFDKARKGFEQILYRNVDREGMMLSGGEQQKIAVSRTHMTDKDILIFDEPAAALDPIAEMEQFQNIKTKTSGKTAILISHRVGFARMADRIFVLENGNLEEVGTHEELMKENGIYADFFNQQAQWYQT